MLFVTKPVPLRTDAAGVLRVGKTRVSLDSVIAAFNEDATPEEIVQQYDVLALADVYTVIAYYLEYQSEIDAYLAKRIPSAHSFVRSLKRVISRKASDNDSSRGATIHKYIYIWAHSIQVGQCEIQLQIIGMGQAKAITLLREV
jgi:uncharacterized protein (DUF433 family)